MNEDKMEMGGDCLIGLNLLARILQEPPDKQFLQEMRPLAGQIFAWPGASSESIILLEKELKKDSATLAHALAEEHAALFSGPFPLAPLWESVWLERDKLLFGKRTLQVEELFADWGLSNDNPDKNPLDNLAFELGLLAWLFELAENKPRALSLSGRTLADSINTLYHDHIMAFAPQALKRIMEKAKSDFYGVTAQNALAMLETLNSE